MRRILEAVAYTTAYAVLTGVVVVAAFTFAP